MKIEEGVFIISTEEEKRFFLQEEEIEGNEIEFETEEDEQKLEEIKFYLNSSSDSGIWSHYKILNLFLDTDETFNPSKITLQMIEKNSKILRSKIRKTDQDLHDFIFQITRNLRLNKSKYDQNEITKLKKQKIEINRILQVISNFENLKFFSIKNHLNLRFFNYQILGFVNNIETFDYKSISKNQYFEAQKELFYHMKDCGNSKVIEYIKDCDMYYEYFYYKLNYVSTLFQWNFWILYIQVFTGNFQKPITNYQILNSIILIFKFFMHLFYLLEKFISKISKDLLIRNNQLHDKFSRIEYSSSCLFFSFISYYNSKFVFFIPTNEFFSLKFSLISGFFFGYFLIEIQGVFIFLIYLLKLIIKKNLKFKRILTIILTSYVLYGMYLYSSLIFDQLSFIFWNVGSYMIYTIKYLFFVIFQISGFIFRNSIYYFVRFLMILLDVGFLVIKYIFVLVVFVLKNIISILYSILTSFWSPKIK